MNEEPMNRSQMVGSQAHGKGNDGRDLERRRGLRLNGFPRELVREEGCVADALAPLKGDIGVGASTIRRKPLIRLR